MKEKSTRIKNADLTFFHSEAVDVKKNITSCKVYVEGDKVSAFVREEQRMRNPLLLNQRYMRLYRRKDGTYRGSFTFSAGDEFLKERLLVETRKLVACAIEDNNKIQKP